MRWPWQKEPENVAVSGEHVQVSERLDTVEEEMKSMAHRILLLEVELGLYGEEDETEIQGNRKG